MSQNEEILELKRLNEKLKSEKAALVKRAARRYQDLMHANRRAERAEQALKNEAWERMDDQTKATNLFCSYKKTIKTLELQLAQAQRFGRSGEQVQVMQATNAVLEAALEKQKEDVIRSQKRASEMIEGLQSRIETDKMQIRKEAEQRYEQRLAEMKIQLSEEFSRKAQANVTQMQKVFQACKVENDSLKQKLSQASQTMDWQRRQTQQQTSEGVSQQIQQDNTSIHSSFPLPTELSSSQSKEVSSKRRRLDSIGNATMSLPDLQRDCGNSSKSSVSRTPKRSARDVSAQPCQQSITPTRQIETTQQYQGLNTHVSPPRQSYQSQKQLQLLPPHLQSIPQAQQLFSGFMHHLNAERLNSGQTLVSHREALPLFHHWVVQRLNRQSPVLAIDDVTLQSMLQQSSPSGQSSSQTDDSRAGLKSPFRPISTSLSLQTLKSFHTPSSSTNQIAGETHRQQSHQTHEQRQQHGNFQGSLKSPAIPIQDLRDVSPIPTSDYRAVSPVMLPKSTFNVQVTPTRNGASVLLPTSAQTDQQSLSDGYNQQNSSGVEKSRPHQHTIDPALLLNGEADLPSGNSLNEQISRHNHLTAIEYLENQVLTPFSQLPSQTVLPDLLTSQERPAPPPSACTTPALSTRSISVPNSPPIPVCLHCHENWWNESCDAGEPCQNCIIACKPCERPRCLNFTVGTCTIIRCPRVHEGDLRYRNVVVRPKTLKRVGKKGEARTSPSVLTHQQG